MADKKADKRFLYHLFHEKKGLSYFLFSIVFICFLIAIVNFTTVYLHCRRDMMRIENSRPMAVKGGSAMPDTVSIIIVRDTMITKIVVSDTLKNGCCCTQSQDNNRDLETLEDVHKMFDNNILTFLISFALIAVLTMLIHDSDKLSEGLSKLSGELSEMESTKASIMSVQETVETRLRELERLEMESRARDNISNYIIAMSLFYYESKLLVFNIESSKYSINELLYAAIESLHIKIDDFNREIPSYSDKLKDEAVFSCDGIDRLIAPLQYANNIFEDLYRSARRYESKLKTRKPNLIPDLQEQTAPLLNSINSLIEKIEGYRAAPKNQQLS